MKLSPRTPEEQWRFLSAQAKQDTFLQNFAKTDCLILAKQLLLLSLPICYKALTIIFNAPFKTTMPCNSSMTALPA